MLGLLVHLNWVVRIVKILEAECLPLSRGRSLRQGLSSSNRFVPVVQGGLACGIACFSFKGPPIFSSGDG